MSEALEPQPIETAPRNGTQIYLIFPGWSVAPLASWEILEGGSEEGSTHAWMFDDDSFGEHGDGWVYADCQQPTHWFPAVKAKGTTR